MLGYLPRKGSVIDDAAQERAIRSQQAWNLFLEAERRELENRRNGHLRKLLGDPVASLGESPEELERLASEDEARADEGLVELRSPHGEITYKHIDELTPDDRTARVAAEGARVEWVTERTRARYPS